MLAKPAPVHALSLDDYFSYSYTIQLSQTEVYQDEVFSATVSGQAVCKKNLPITPNAASITSRITARHNTTGDEIVLNSGYTVDLDSFPTQPGDSVQDSVVVPLSFPDESQSGTYTITGEIVTAKVRVLAFWLDVTRYLPQSQTLGNITCFTRYINDNGEFLMKYTAKSADSRAAATFQRGTIGVTRDGTPLREITVTEKTSPPPPPADSAVIGLVYDFGPEGASFDQPVTIRLSYDQAQLPENVAEENLIIVSWDSQLQEWAQLESKVDTLNNVITTEVTHFSLYNVLAYTRPADFTVSNLSISPPEATTGEKISVSVVVNNTGDLTGIYQLELKVDGEVYFMRSARLDGGNTVTESFLVYWDTAGVHSIDIAGLSGTFIIDEGETLPDTEGTTPPVLTTLTVDVTPVDIADGESVVIRVLLTNASDKQDTCRVSLMKDNIRAETKEISLDGGDSQSVIFTTLKETEASYTVEITGPSGVFTIEDMPPSISEIIEPPPTATLNRWLVGGIISFCVIGALAGFLIIMRRRASTRNA
jgi:hypothetical protein